MAKKLDGPCLAGSEGKPFELSGPYEDGIIGVHRPGDSLVAAKLRFKEGDKAKGWEWSTANTVYWDELGKSIVDIRAAVAKANKQFPKGPVQRAV